MSGDRYLCNSESYILVLHNVFSAVLQQNIYIFCIQLNNFNILLSFTEKKSLNISVLSYKIFINLYSSLHLL